MTIHEPGRPGCVISMNTKRCENCESHGRREENGEKAKVSALHIPPRRVARVLSMWKYFQAGGLGTALRPQMGPGQSPGGGPGGEAPGS